jgi:DNA-binding GntR family transcriptional regulator
MLDLRANDVSLQLHTPVPEDASLAERAYYELRDRIVSLDLRPGSLIREESLMTELGMSRTPIREALLRLGLEKLVVVVGRRGTFVSDVNVGDVGMIYEFRREMEGVAAGWAAARRPESAIPRIEAVLAELRAVPDHPPPDTDARSQILPDQLAHQLVYDLCGNRFLRDMLIAYYFLAVRVWFLASGRVVMDEPERLMVAAVEAIATGDAAEASRCARLHNEAAESAIRAAL